MNFAPIENGAHSVVGSVANPSAKNLFGVLGISTHRRALTSSFAAGREARPSPPSGHTITVPCIVQQPFDVYLVGQSPSLGELSRAILSS